MYEDWGFAKLFERINHEMEEEAGHADALMRPHPDARGAACAGLISSPGPMYAEHDRRRSAFGPPGARCAVQGDQVIANSFNDYVTRNILRVPGWRIPRKTIRIGWKSQQG